MPTARSWVTLAPLRPVAPGPWVAHASAWAQAVPDAATPAGGVATGGVDPVSAALRFAVECAAAHPFPGGGRTAELWELLATVAAADLGAARAVEPHLDALTILDQAGRLDLAAGSTTWGVFAAEGGDDPLTATRAADGGWTLTGTKPWCSLADRLDRALVSARLAPVAAPAPSAPSEGGTAATSNAPAGGAAPASVQTPTRGLFAVDLHEPGVAVVDGAWKARGLSEIPSGPVRFEAVPVEPVGDPGWYLRRPGFSWGGISVAACWFGGTVGLARTLFNRAAVGSDPLLHMHLGAVDVHIENARRALAEAAVLVDAGSAVGDPGRLLAKRVRATVAHAAEATLTHVAHALGPAPLALDAEHSKRVADLELYIRQHHAEKDDLSLGRQLAVATGPSASPAGTAGVVEVAPW